MCISICLVYFVYRALSLSLSRVPAQPWRREVEPLPLFLTISCASWVPRGQGLRAQCSKHGALGGRSAAGKVGRVADVARLVRAL